MAHVPAFDLKRNYLTVKDEILSALDEVLSSQQFIMGPVLEAFEKDCEAYLGVPHAVGCASGSDALLLALRALGVGEGDKVVTTPFTFFATVSAITRLGARPLFVDVKEDTYNLDDEALLDALSEPGVKALLPVHLFGQMVPLERVIDPAREKGAFIVEDTAQSFGACRRLEDRVVKAGAWGDAGTFSFFPTKNLGAYGDAGMVALRDDAAAERVRSLRVHGAAKQYFHEEVGYNSRLDALQAAILRVRLRHLEEWNEARRAAAARYELLFDQAGLAEFICPPAELEGNRHIYHQYVIRAQRRDELQAYLTERGVGCRVYYPLSLHLQHCFADLGYRPGQFPVSERLTEQVLALPMFPELMADEQIRVVEAMKAFYRG